MSRAVSRSSVPALGCLLCRSTHGSHASRCNAVVAGLNSRHNYARAQNILLSRRKDAQARASTRCPWLSQCTYTPPPISRTPTSTPRHGLSAPPQTASANPTRSSADRGAKDNARTGIAPGHPRASLRRFRYHTRKSAPTGRRKSGPQPPNPSLHPPSPGRPTLPLTTPYRPARHAPRAPYCCLAKSVRSASPGPTLQSHEGSDSSPPKRLL